MRALIQRVLDAQVTVDNKVVGSCGHGLLVFLGVGQQDTQESAQRLWQKISKLRIFADEQGKTKEQYLRTERSWTVGCVAAGIVLLVLATWYNVSIRGGM